MERLSTVLFYWSITCHVSAVWNPSEKTFGLLLDPQMNTSQLIDAIDQYYHGELRYICSSTLPKLIWRQIDSSDGKSLVSTVTGVIEAGVDAVVSVLSPQLQTKLVYVVDSLRVPHVAVGLGSAPHRPQSDVTVYTSPHPGTRRAAIQAVLDAVVRENGWKSVTFLLGHDVSSSLVQDLLFHLSKLYVQTRLLKMAKENYEEDVKNQLLFAKRKESKVFFIMTDFTLRKLFISQASSLNMLGDDYFWIFFSDDTPMEREENIYHPLMFSNTLVIKRHWEPFSVCCSSGSQQLTASFGYLNQTVVGVRLVEAVSLVDRALTMAIRSPDHGTAGNPNVRQQKLIEQLYKGVASGHGVKAGFDVTGHPRVTLYDLYSTSKRDSPALARVGHWSRQQGITLQRRFFLNKFVDFDGADIPVAALEHSPFYMNRTVDGIPMNVGLCMDIMNELGRRLNFSYRIIQPPDNQYGTLEQPGASWNGMVGMVVRGEVFMAAGPFTATSDRATVVEFSKSYMEISSSIITRKTSSDSENLYQVFKPFPIETWCSIAAAVVVVGLSCAFVNRNSPSRAGKNKPILSKMEESVWHNIWSMYSSLVDQGPTFYPESISGRYVLGVWWVFCTLVVSMYTAVLAAYLTVSAPIPHIDSLSDLVNRPDIRVLLAAGSNTYSLFRDSKHPTYQQVWRQAQSSPVVELKDEALALVLTGPYALISDARGLEFSASQSCDRFIVAEERFNKGSYTFILPKGAPYLEAVNFNMMKILEAGLVEAWWKKWTEERQPCNQSSSNGQRKLPLNKLGGVFIIYSLIAGVAVLVFLFTNIWERVLKSALHIKSGQTYT